MQSGRSERLLLRVSLPLAETDANSKGGRRLAVNSPLHSSGIGSLESARLGGAELGKGGMATGDCLQGGNMPKPRTFRDPPYTLWRRSSPTPTPMASTSPASTEVPYRLPLPLFPFDMRYVISSLCFVISVLGIVSLVNGWIDVWLYVEDQDSAQGSHKWSFEPSAPPGGPSRAAGREPAVPYGRRGRVPRRGGRRRGGSEGRAAARPGPRGRCSTRAPPRQGHES